MAYKKKYATEEERHAARVEIGRMGAAKSAEARRRNKKAIPATMMRVHVSDKQVLDAMAKHLGVPATELLHQVAETLKIKHPSVFG